MSSYLKIPAQHSYSHRLHTIINNMGCCLCQNSEFYELAMKCWYLQKLTGIYELSYWYLRPMLVFGIHAYTRGWYRYWL